MDSPDLPAGALPGARDTSEDPGPSPAGTPPAPGGAERGDLTAPFKAPVISLPKGGGAVRGMGEKLSVSPATGTATLTVPLPLSPGRGDSTPRLRLTYDTGTGNGPFGIGWSLDLPAVTRRTDKGVPAYDDDSGDTDVFLLSGAEDLVPCLDAGGRPLRRPRTVAGVTYDITRYRPRTEGLYARVERWTARHTGETHWRTISPTDVTTVYGRDARSRIADPADPVRRVFSWLICESYDDKGNTTVYGYRAEDGTGADLAAAHERHRTPADRSAGRHLKSVRYGNRVSRLDASREQTDDDWLFELVLDYGEHHPTRPRPGDTGAWRCRDDPFSTYRSGFEIRTYRLCRRFLMFHHFPDEPEVGRDCLVRSQRFTYRGTPAPPAGRPRGGPAGTLLTAITRSGHRTGPGGPVTRSLPPLELTYSTPAPDGRIHELDRASLENLPAGIDGTLHQWADLDGESLPGVLTSQGGALLYKPNEGGGRLGTQRAPAAQPALPLGGGRGRLLDLAGDGRLDLVDLGGPAPGFHAREGGGWSPHRAFRSLPVLDWNDPNLRFADMDGDGLADVLVTEGDAILWYPSLGEAGFGPGVRVPTGPDEDAGPRLLFADGTGSVHLADLSGDGLLDLVRVRDGEICYWPGLGRGRFGARVVMDNAPHLDHPDRYDPRRVHFADVDGTGPADLVHVGADGVDIFVNLLGNAWSDPARPTAFPPVDDPAAVSVVDLLGTGTSCLVWSSRLPSDTGRHIRYADLTGPKPHLLVRVVNNLGGETALTHTTSTHLYLRDKAEGRPWLTRLPFPVHVVERTETYDRINRNRFVTRYHYHDGYFDPVEREFRGFASVEQDDTEHIGALGDGEVFPAGANEAPAHRLPPVRTRSWYHTGAHLGRERLSRRLAERYYPPSGTAVPEALTWLLDDTPLPDDLPPDAERQACRALRGQLLRQEVYALDGTDDEAHPYTVTERNHTVRMLQAPTGDHDGVFAVDPRESVTVVCERRPRDARVVHEAVLDVDPHSGTVLHSVTLAHGRGTPDPELPARTRTVQATTLVTETRVQVTRPVDTTAADGTDAHRVPVAYDTRTLRISGRDTAAGIDVDHCAPRLSFGYLRRALRGPLPDGLTRTLVGRHRTRFLADDLSGPLPWGEQQSLGLPHQTQRLALTDALRAEVYGPRADADRLTGAGYLHDEDGWWVPSGTVRYAPPGDPDPSGTARRHFCLPCRFVDPFAAADPAGEYATDIEHDPYDLLIVRTTDAVGNTVTADRSGLDYRVLAPTALTDPNGNRTAVLFDTLGMPVATAVRGKPGDDTGDRLDGIDPDPPPEALAAFFAAPHEHTDAFLGRATSRAVCDLGAYHRSRDTPAPAPVASASLTRARHVRDGGDEPPQITIGYSDGNGREIQRKTAAEPAPGTTATRWVGSGWTVLNNKGLPVRQYEPFFSPVPAFEFAVEQGVSPLLCYDPPGRLIATLHPNHTYEKTVIGPWQQYTWDVNDTAALPGPDGRPTGSPADDPDTARYTAALPADAYLPTWYRRRADGGLGPHERAAAERTLPHTATPLLTCLDPLGRLVLTVAHNRTPAPGGPPVDSAHRTYADLDITGDLVALHDCVDGRPGPAPGTADRTVARYRYDLLGNRVHERSMEAGEFRRLFDIDGEPVTVWDVVDDVARAERVLTTSHDRLRRPLDVTLTQGGSTTTVQRTRYGESAPDPASGNLRGQVHRVDDGSGTLTHRYDAQGNPTEVARTLTTDHRTVPDWSAEPALADRTWTTRTVFDALDRPREVHHPDGSVVTRAYNRRGLLDTVDAVLAPDTASTSFVRSAEYDAKGRRIRVAYAGGATTTCTYDPDTFRLATLRTTRDRGRADVQHLVHVHDPAGNITHVEDCARPAVFHLNTRVEASTDHVYDAMYRLVESHGREHLTARGPRAPAGFPGAHTADRGALGRYRETYTYDTAGNLTALDHRTTDPRHPGWRRVFVHEERNPLQPPGSDLPSNRLTRSTLTGEHGHEERYHHDALGQLDILPPLRRMTWDHTGQLRSTATQHTGPGLEPETTVYGYDSARRRVRRVRDGQAPAGATGRALEERIHLGDLEVHRRYDADGATVLERTTLHLMDGRRRIALVETRVDAGAAGDPHARTVRHQHTGHSGSVAVELDADGEVVSYEEYHPYGTTAVAFWRGGAPPKRYRYSGKERDATGLYYYGDRYYAPWLCRWISPDPGGVADGPDLYVFVQGNPVSFKDPDGREVEAYSIAPGRPGNQPWAWFLGVSAHRLIGKHYEASHMDESRRIYTNYHTVASILKASHIGDQDRLTPAQQALKPDIANVASREVFEIKPWNQEGLEAGRRQVRSYIDALNTGMGVPPTGRGKGPARYPFLTGRGAQGELAVRFRGGRMIWRLVWKTTEDGIVQYKWQKPGKPERERLKESGEGQWVDITEQDAEAHGQEVAEAIDQDLALKDVLYGLMDATNTAQTIVGEVAMALLNAGMLSAQPGAGAVRAPVRTPVPPTAPAPRVPIPSLPPPSRPPGVPGGPPPPWQLPPAPPPGVQPRP
ncbi:sugar-binding protein [Streptomyces sp. SID4919]|uniref:SpvB/TcaC N-terminal domain-containing protein n=1 Tax=unclassified Streptomyces TaxID=2593676 RepID=UPI000823B936|nr:MULTISPECIES: SpvB/TcaC N-terminal domain-containing protein [unclassified Streptomyces]MYY08029.1 sugar-binding protein [Streptomyces sp. SID4919]SCK08178.1 RHS repeat-associated core domain-containing protein [Streptomyces sp. AmelKG-E11A]